MYISNLDTFGSEFQSATNREHEMHLSARCNEGIFPTTLLQLSITIFHHWRGQPLCLQTIVCKPATETQYTVLPMSLIQGGGTGGQMPPQDFSCPPKHMTPINNPSPALPNGPPQVSTIINFAPSRTHV